MSRRCSRRARPAPCAPERAGSRATPRCTPRRPPGRGRSPAIPTALPITKPPPWIHTSTGNGPSPVGVTTNAGTPPTSRSSTEATAAPSPPSATRPLKSSRASGWRQLLERRPTRLGQQVEHGLGGRIERHGSPRGGSTDGRSEATRGPGSTTECRLWPACQGLVAIGPEEREAAVGLHDHQVELRDDRSPARRARPPSARFW